MSYISRLSALFRSFISSSLFFHIVVGYFILSASWVATASLYPMAFDEDFHIGLIRIYAGHLFPFGIQDNPDWAVYGPAANDVSYLFAYLLSFPYRILMGMGASLEATVIILRLVNIALVTASLFVYKMVLERFKIGRFSTHLIIAFFTLIPIMPMLAGQINYDNPLLLIVAGSFLLAHSIVTAFSKKTFPLSGLLFLTALTLIGASVKYAYLPIAAGIWLWVIYEFIRRYKTLDIRKHLTLNVPVVIGIILVLLSGFFATKYIINKIEYGSFIPSCEQVYTEDQCMAYGPWGRNKTLADNLSPDFEPNSPLVYLIQDWIPGMATRLFFAVAGPTNNYATVQPLPILLWLYAAMAISGLVAVAVWCIKKAPRPNQLWMPVVIGSALYIGSLFIKIYDDYTTTGEAVAVNGRYLLLLLPLVAALLATSFSTLITKYRRLTASAIVLLCALLLITLIQGGGVGTYIVLADASWFWEGWGQASHHLLQTVYSFLVIR